MILKGLEGMSDRDVKTFAFSWSLDEMEALRAQDAGPQATALLELLERNIAPPGRSLRKVLESSVSATPGARQVDPHEARVELPTFSSGFPPLDAHGRGFCGITSIAGETGVGKSMWAAGASVEAALQGWRVVYLNVELDASTFLSYFGNYCTQPSEYRRAVERTRFWFCDPGVDLEYIARLCVQSVEDEDSKVLIVLDSIDSFSESTSDRGGANQFVEQRRWLFWAMQCRRATAGHIAFILLGEKNADGYLKGRKGAFTADNVLSVSYSQSPGHFLIKQEKGRYCGRADYGECYLDHETCRYKGVVGGGEA